MKGVYLMEVCVHVSLCLTDCFNCVLVCRDILDLRDIQQDMAQLVHEQGGEVQMIGKQDRLLLS